MVGICAHVKLALQRALVAILTVKQLDYERLVWIVYSPTDGFCANEREVKTITTRYVHSNSPLRRAVSKVSVSFSIFLLQLR
jgi:hypothetical protein